MTTVLGILIKEEVPLNTIVNSIKIIQKTKKSVLAKH